MAAAPGDGKNLAVSIFQKHDKDGSGALDKKEADDLIEDFCQTLELELSAKERQDLLTKSFNEADRNGDGVLSMPEFMSFAATLDSLASSLAGAVNPSGDTSESVVPTGSGTKKTLVDAALGKDSGALFDEYDVNRDTVLDVEEAVKLLQASCTELGITTEWVTTEFVTDHFHAAIGSSAAPRDGEQPKIRKEEFQTFCMSIMNFMSQLGGALEREGPPATAEEIEAQVAAAREVEAQVSAANPPPEAGGQQRGKSDAPAAAAESGCCIVS